MSHRYFIANWKMNFDAKESSDLASKLANKIKSDKVEIVVCPAMTALSSVSKSLQGRHIKMGAQNMSWLDKGSLTGEVAGFMLKEWGVEYVIVGHSERRINLKEDDAAVNQKVQAAVRAGLTPVLCVGETFIERQAGRKDFVIAGQVEMALKNVNLENKKILVAYEPVWVIGSGQAVSVDEAEHAVRVIKQVVIDLYPKIYKSIEFDVLYGGSIKVENIIPFAESKILSGILVGSASLKEDEFIDMVGIMEKNKIC